MNVGRPTGGPEQQVYHSAPQHPLWDILENIAPLGLAVPGDGDGFARHCQHLKENSQ